MKFKIIAIAVSLIAFNAHGAAVDSVQVVDPYANDQSNSPWTKAMTPVTTATGVKLTGSASGVTSKNQGGFDTFTPFAQSKSSLVKGFGSSTVGVGCDGINLGGVIDGQISQYATMIEEFIAQAPALAVMFLAYSQPTVKAVIDELNVVGQFGLDLSNMTCSGVRALADKSAEEKKQAMAEAECTSDAGYKDPNCMSGSGITSSLVQLMQKSKTTVNDRAGALMGKVTNATGGLVAFNASTSGATSGNAGSMGQYLTGVTSRNCPNEAPEGLLGYIMGASEISCDDLKNYSGLLPNYGSKDDVSGIEPRKMTLLDVSKKMTDQYYSWFQNAIEADESIFNQSEGFKAIYNRTGMVISDDDYRALRRLAKDQPAEFVGVHRNLATIAMLKDLTGVVNRLEVAVLTGIQNQPDGEHISDRQIEQYAFAVATLRSELTTLRDQITADMDRARLTKG